MAEQNVDVAREFVEQRSLITRQTAKSLGLNRYFTGLRCPRGHISERRTSTQRCIECGRDDGKRLRNLSLARPQDGLIPSSFGEALKMGSSVYFTGMPCKRGHICERYTKDRKCMQCNLADHRAWHQRNAEQNNQNSALWREMNPDRRLANFRKFHNENPEAGRTYQHTRRARKQVGGGTFTAKELASLLSRQRFRCVYCSANLKKVGYHADHIMPLALGGSNTIWNIQALCQRCNNRKYSLDPIAFARKIGLLL